MKRFKLVTMFLFAMSIALSIPAHAFGVSYSEKKAHPDLVSFVSDTTVGIDNTVFVFTVASAYLSIGESWLSPADLSLCDPFTSTATLLSDREILSGIGWLPCKFGISSASVKINYLTHFKLPGKHSYTAHKYPYQGFQRYWCTRK